MGFADDLAAARIESDIVRYRKRPKPSKLLSGGRRRGKPIKSVGYYCDPGVHDALVRLGAVRAEIEGHGRAVSSINREAAAMAEGIAPDTPWATDEPTPDLSHLWETPGRWWSLPDGRVTRFNPNRLHRSGYLAWMERHLAIDERTI